MKHNNYFTYERNHYFYGKLLTEHDFENEQKYGNDKRRLINRYLHGAGIVSGLQVVAVDEKTISVETGFALDFAGREIVVDVPVMKKLSLIDGYDSIAEQNDRAYCYLCIEYDEQPSGQIVSTVNNNQEFARYKEGYRLYLTSMEPQERSYQTEYYYEREMVLYHDHDLHVIQKVPRVIKTGGKCPIKIQISSEREQQDLSIHIVEKMEHMNFKESELLNIDLDHITLENGEKKEFIFDVQVKHVSDCEARLTLDEPIQIVAHGVEQSVPIDANITIPVIDGDLEEALADQFYKGSFEQISRTGFMNGIYLAKIELIKGGSLLIVDRVTNNPFEQKVYSNYMLRACEQWKGQNTEVHTAGITGKPNKISETLSRHSGTREGHNIRIAQGKVSLDMGIGGKRGQTFFSDKIVHGLGLGMVDIHLSIENQEYLYGGSHEVFPEMTIQAELATKADPGRGTFTIGVRLLETTSEQTMTIHWTAITAASAYGDLSETPRIYIQPSVLQMRVREEGILKAEVEGVDDKTVEWSCERGDIDKNGVYTAPNEPGIYEITAVSKEDEKLTASIYAVVREEKQES